MRSTPALLALLLLPHFAVQAGSDTFTVEVNAAQTQGTIKDLLGVNKTPLFNAKDCLTSYDASSLYTAFGVSQARLHDTGIDLCTIYKAATKLNVGVSPAVPVSGCQLTGGNGNRFSWTPTSSADADINNPDNYDFTAMDQGVLKLVAAGSKIYLGLAQDFNGPNDTSDPVAWAKVSANIYRHLIGQFKPTAGIAVDPNFVEIHNEPDGGFWRGDAATFNTLYAESNTRIRAAAAGKSLKVGGAGFTRSILTSSKQSGNPANGFIATMGAANLDFYSAHLYDKCANASLTASATFLRALRALVDSGGGTGKPLHITEWNIGLGTECGNTLFAEQRTQSFGSGLLTLMQDPAYNIEAAHYYAGVTVMSLFDFTSVANAVRVNPAAWGFWAHNKLRGTTGLTTQVCPSTGGCVAGTASDSTNLVAITGQSASRQTTVVSNDSSTAVSYTLRTKGLTSSVASVLVSNPPQGAKDIAVSGSPLAASSSTLSALMATVTTQSLSNLTPSAGQLELSLTVPAYSVQIVDLWPGLASVPTTSAAITSTVTAAPTSGVAPLTVRFSGAGSSTVAADVMSYFWTFGDGSTSTEQSPNHTYSAPGGYSVTLQVTNTMGQSATSTAVALSVLDASGSSTAADADKVFAWGEKTYPQVFAPGGQSSKTITGYRYRAYNAGHYLAVNDSGAPHLYYLGPLSENTVLDLGLLSGWLAQAGP